MSELTTKEMVDQIDVIMRLQPTRTGIPRDARVVYLDVLREWGERLKLIESIDLARLRELTEAERNHEAIIPKLDCKTCHWRKDRWRCNSCYGTLTPENYANWYELDDEIKWKREEADKALAADAGKGESGCLRIL